MLIEMMLRDPGLQLQTGTHIEELSKEQTPPDASERLFDSFVARLNFMAAREKKEKAVQTASRGGK